MMHAASKTSSSSASDVQHVRQVRRVTLLGLVVNLVLATLKLIAGIVGASQAVVADAIHSFADGVTDMAILVGVRYWSAPPDAEHPHGHGRIETLVTTGIGVLVGGIALGLVYNALVTMREIYTPSPGWIAFAAATLSIVSKEILYRWTVRVGRRIRSPAVVANAWHHRSDGLSSIPAAVAVAIAAYSPGWSFLDHVGALVVSVFILQAAWKIARPALGQLIDTGASAEDLDQIEQIALAVDGVRTVHAIRTRYVGSGIQADLHIKVDPEMTVRDGHDISELVKRRLIADGPEIVDVVVHLEPHET